MKKTLRSRKTKIHNHSVKRSRVHGGNKDQTKIFYNEKPILCDTCQGDIFNEIDISVQRSKTAEFFIGSDNVFVDHPLRTYRCIVCSQCKFYYTPTSFNGFKDVIVEKPI